MIYYLNGSDAITSITSIPTRNTIGGLNFGFYLDSVEVNTPTERIGMRGFISGYGVGDKWTYRQTSSPSPNYIILRVYSRSLQLCTSFDKNSISIIAILDIPVNLPDKTIAIWKSVSEDDIPNFVPILTSSGKTIGAYGENATAFTLDPMYLNLNENGFLQPSLITVNVAGSNIETQPTFRHYVPEDDSAIRQMTVAISNADVKSVIASSGFVTR